MGSTEYRGFTLIELVLVIAIVAVVLVIALGRFDDMRMTAARQANVANIQNVTRAVNTEIARLAGASTVGVFDRLDSLVDVAPGGGEPTGTEGAYLFRERWFDGRGGFIPGVWCGVKTLGTKVDAEGSGGDDPAELAPEHERMTGIAAADRLGLYYLKGDEVKALREAGLGVVRRHGWSRDDADALVPLALTNGSAVAVLNPAASASVYCDLGLEYGTTYGVGGLDAKDPSTYFAKGICRRLYVFGLGRGSAAERLFDTLPYCQTVDARGYRGYLVVFADGVTDGKGVTFAGVLDPEGNTARQAQHNADWAE